MCQSCGTFNALYTSQIHLYNYILSYFLHSCDVRTCDICIYMYSVYVLQKYTYIRIYEYTCTTKLKHRVNIEKYLQKLINKQAFIQKHMTPTITCTYMYIHTNMQCTYIDPMYQFVKVLLTSLCAVVLS